MKLNLVKIQRFSTHDGPGIRTAVFFKGCPLRCAWCHNPETQSAAPQIFYHRGACIGCGACAEVCPGGAHSFTPEHRFDVTRCAGCQRCAEVCPAGAIESVGMRMDVEQVMDAVLRDSAFYGADGGVTVSGGEPMFQPDACIALLRAAKERGITTAIETCGCFDPRWIPELTRWTDHFLWDLKDGVPSRHRQFTGADSGQILRNLLAADETAAEILLRCIMVRGVNMDEANLAAIADTYRRLRHCIGVELIPYHAYGGSKAEQLGYAENGREDWIPTREDMDRVRAELLRAGCRLIGEK